MTLAAPPLAPPAGGEAITADRQELKYLMDRAEARSFVRTVATRLPVHRFTGEGANKLPDPQHFVTTIYFDTPSHAHLCAALADREQNVKIRAREYYDLHPSLAELATCARQIVRYQPWVWFEIKRRAGGRTQKTRFRLPKREVPAFFRGEHAAFDMTRSGCHDAALDDIVAYCRALPEPLVPSCLVSYQRIAFQDAAGSTRLTLDLDVAFYPVPDDLWERSHALVRSTLGVPAAVERRVLIEVKLRDEPPRWLAQALRDTRAAQVSYSKFARAGVAVHGPL